MSEVTIVVEEKTSTIVEVHSGNIGPKGDQGIQGIQGPMGVTVISLADDVDVAARTNGSILSWDNTTSKWVAKNELNSIKTDGGNF
jgi:hypothetical protein